MNTRYALTFGTTLVVGGALFTGTAYALSNTDEQKTTMGDSIRITQQSAFFDRYIDKAVKHARAAETAGTQGYATDLLTCTIIGSGPASSTRRECSRVE
jgi:hypothetical protein